MNDLELVALLKGSKQDKDEAFREIYSRYSKMVHAYCACMTYDRDQVEEIFQETFVRFYKSIQNNSRINNIPGYLHTIARNIGKNHNRDRKLNTEITENTLTEDSRIDYDNRELMELILNTVELLEPMYRDVFILHEFEGLNYGEIASRYGISQGNVKIRYLRSKQKLIKLLNPYIKDLSK